MKREESRHDFAFMAGVVIGAIAGALGALALAPRAGVETRENWRARVDELPVEDFRARAYGLRDLATTQADQIRQAAASGDVIEATRVRVVDIVNRSPIPVTIGDASDASFEETVEEISVEVEPADELIDEVSAGIEPSASELADESDEDEQNN